MMPPSVMYDDDPSTITEWIRYLIFSFTVIITFFLFILFLIPFTLVVIYKEKRDRKKVYGV